MMNVNDSTLGSFLSKIMGLKLPWRLTRRSWYFTLSYLTVTLGISLLGQYISQFHGTKYEFGKPELFDIVHWYLPDVSPYYWVNHIMVALVAFRFLSIRQNVQHYLFLTGTALAIRAVTLMPTSQTTCTPQCFADGGSFPINTCYDYMFSGHTVCLTIAALCITLDTKPRRWEKICWACYIPLCALWISMSRQHYTCDVLMGMMIGTLMTLGSEEEAFGLIHAR